MDFFEKRKAVADGQESGPVVSEEFKKTFPMLGKLLEGTPKTLTSPAIQPFSLSVWADETGWRFSLSARGTDEVWFGGAAAGGNVFKEVEKAVREGELTPKRAKGGKPVF